MEPLALVRRAGLGLLGTLLASLMLAAVARSTELVASGAPRDLAFHDAGETLRDWCRWDDAGRLWLVLPDSSRFELVTSVNDAAIANPGDGAFHPFELGEVHAALDELSYPVAGLRADVFLLPFPRRAGLESAGGPGLVLLSPGVRPLSREQQHAEFVHELGHVVQQARLPDHATGDWTAYRRMRGIEDPIVFSASAPHAQRPHEIFAEDFRALLGGATANSTGTIENPALTPPQLVPGLREFVLSLAGHALRARLSGAPNPSRGAVTFSRAGTSAAMLDVFDVGGRRLAAVAPMPVAGGTEWRWDGRAARGTAMGPAIVFARERAGAAEPVRVALVP